MILASNNTMSEIRMLSFIFSSWDILTADASRKAALCVDWLLTEEVFEKLFNNWCPMVRAYYMRLLCWRMCRDAGSTNQLDANIFLLVSRRLRTVWSHYLWLKQKADSECLAPPSTAPCLPMPGRRFAIVRTEVGGPQQGLFTGFDAVSSSFAHSGLVGADLRGSPYGPGSSDEKKSGGDSSSAARKKWSLLGRVLSLTSTTAGAAPQGQSGTAKPTYDEQFEHVRRDLAVSRSPPRQVGGGGGDGPPSTPASTTAKAERGRLALFGLGLVHRLVSHL